MIFETFKAIKIVPAKFASEEKKYRSLTTECTIMAAFRNPFVLSHKYPEISKFFGPRETDFIPEVAFEKYGWSDGSGKRHLMDLLYFMTDMVNNIKSDQYQLKMYKQQNEENMNEADLASLNQNIANLNHMRAQRNHDVIGIGWKVIDLGPRNHKPLLQKVPFDSQNEKIRRIFVTNRFMVFKIPTLNLLRSPIVIILNKVQCRYAILVPYEKAVSLKD